MLIEHDAANRARGGAGQQCGDRLERIEVELPALDGDVSAHVRVRSAVPRPAPAMAVAARGTTRAGVGRPPQSANRSFVLELELEFFAVNRERALFTLGQAHVAPCPRRTFRDRRGDARQGAADRPAASTRSSACMNAPSRHACVSPSSSTQRLGRAAASMPSGTGNTSNARDGSSVRSVKSSLSVTGITAPARTNSGRRSIGAATVIDCPASCHTPRVVLVPAGCR